MFTNGFACSKTGTLCMLLTFTQKIPKRPTSKKTTHKRKDVYAYEEYAPFAPFPSFNSYNSYPAETDEDEPRQCYGPNCVEPARHASKYCSDDCGLKLATRFVERRHHGMQCE